MEIGRSSSELAAELQQVLDDEEVARVCAEQESFYIAWEMQTAEQGCRLRQKEKERQKEENASLQLALQLAKQQWDEKSQSRHVRNPINKAEIWRNLTQCQLEAMHYVDSIARGLHHAALPGLMDRVVNLGVTKEDLDICLSYIRDEAPIVIHLKEATIAKLCKDPGHLYRSQFETRTSGGTLDHDMRQQWEDTMFGNAYSGARDIDHPKYGCLNITGDIFGVHGARVYGEFYLTLGPGVRSRTSFSNQDTGCNAGRGHLATNDWYAHVLSEYSDNELRTVLRVGCESRLRGAPSTAFSQYKECQIHGRLSIETDVIALAVPGRKADASDNLWHLVESFQRMSGCNVMWQCDLLED